VRRISKKTREEAIEVLLCCADDRIKGKRTTTSDIGDGPSEWIASDAWTEAWTSTDYVTNSEFVYLEAAALLRDGWSPGDPVVRRGGGS
jgi:hypothetical protein